MNVNIVENHSHELTVTAEEVAAAVEVTYDIEGGGTHNHTVTVSAADFTALAAGETVMIESSMGTHLHAITLSCG